MKNLLKFLTLTAIGYALMAGPALAQNEARILPPNPFYFLKEWQRGIKVALSGPRKAEAILDVLDDKAIDFARTGSNKVLNSYKESEKQLGARISAVAQNNELLDQLFDHALRNYFIFDVQLLAGVFNAERFSLAVNRQDNPLRELIAAELIESIETYQPTRLKEDLIITLLGKIAADESLIEAIKNMNSDSLRRIKVLDQARELISDSDFKTKLNLLRQQILESAAGISETVSRVAIDYAVALLANQKIERAEFQLGQAKQLQASGNYVAAFGQASIASAVIKNAMLKAAYDKEGFTREVEELKKQYEVLSAELKDNADAKKLLDEAKRLINRLSRLSSANVAFLNNLKIILATLENLP